MCSKNSVTIVALVVAIVLGAGMVSHSSTKAAFESTGRITIVTEKQQSTTQPFASGAVLKRSVNAATFNLWLPLIVASLSTPPASSAVYWGALVNGESPTTANLQPGGVFDVFETRAKKKMSVLHWGQPWKMNGNYQSFYAPWFVNVRQHGSIPLIDWGSWDLNAGPNQPDFQLVDIYNGAHDAYIRQWANDAKGWGHPFFLRLDWEMNGNWQFPWSEQLNGNQPGDYIKAWRHVHDLFAQAAVTNVTWVWCPNISGRTTLPMSSLYPGDAYVDWTCLDGYNKEIAWLDFNQVFNGVGVNWVSPSYDQILAVAPNKPIMIAETASLEAGDGGAKKATWITDALGTQLPTFFPKIKAILWFNWDDGIPAYTFPIESSSASINAFASAIGSNYYPANTFGNLNISPIPPPK
jgi:hypothetical protein